LEDSFASEVGTLEAIKSKVTVRNKGDLILVTAKMRGAELSADIANALCGTQSRRSTWHTVENNPLNDLETQLQEAEKGIYECPICT
jgi:hypothetical protein